MACRPRHLSPDAGRDDHRQRSADRGYPRIALTNERHPGPDHHRNASGLRRARDRDAAAGLPAPGRAGEDEAGDRRPANRGDGGGAADAEGAAKWLTAIMRTSTTSWTAQGTTSSRKPRRIAS